MKKILVLFLLSFLTPLWANSFSLNQKGSHFFKKKQYQKALKKYSAALLRAPESKVLHYNLGSAYYKLNNYEQALQEYEKALGVSDKIKRSQVYYNMGNSYYRMNKYKEAIDSYVETLKLNPNDKDAKYNIEVIREKMKNNPKKKQQNKNQQQNQKKQQQNKNDQQNKQNGQKNKSQQNKQSQKKGEISKKEAERILNALKEDEKKAQKKKTQKMQVRGGRYVEKDW